MSRLQLALAVSDMQAAVAFYSKLFQTEPSKARAGYANFVITEPPLKLVLIGTPATRGAGVAGALDHLGIEVDSTEAVKDATDRLWADGLATAVETNTSCCYALQDKVWVADPDDRRWEIYTVLADDDRAGIAPRSGCCNSDPAAAAEGDDEPALRGLGQNGDGK